MDDGLPGPLRVNWRWALALWAVPVVFLALAARHAGPLAGALVHLGPVLWPWPLAGLAFLYGPWRSREALRRFARAVPHAAEARVDLGEKRLAFAWPGLGLEVEATADLRNPASWRLRAKAGGHAWGFEPRAAEVAAREALARLGRGHQVRAPGVHDAPWPVTGGLWYGAPLVALLVGVLVAVEASEALALPAAGATIALLYGLAFLSHRAIRRGVWRFVRALDAAGLAVDGPHLTGGGLWWPRYVVFTDEGPLAVRALALGPRRVADLEWRGGAGRIDLDAAEAAAAEVAGELVAARAAAA